MIYLGLDDSEKDAEVSRYCSEHGISRVFVLSPEKFRPSLTVQCDHIEWSDIIEYKHYYRLLQEIDTGTLLVVNECLRKQNRHDLTYNCIRNFLQQTRHQLVFQYLPLIDTFDDFMILFDLDTRSRWKREKWRESMRSELSIQVRQVDVRVTPLQVETTARTRAAYKRKKRSIIDGLGLGDPHTIPRNLHLVPGKEKLAHVDPAKQYVGRNNRFKLPNLHTYRDRMPEGAYSVFEFCHNFIDFADFLALSRHTEIEALASDLPVDQWYLQRYQDWTQKIRDAYATLHG